MIDISAFIMTTCHPKRLAWLEETLEHMDKQNFPFIKKILAVDQFNGHTMPFDIYERLISRGWLIILDSHRSRSKSMTNAFNLIRSNYIFYNEEDVKVDLPQIDDLEEMFINKKYNDRECGMISLTLGGSSNHFPENQYGDLKDIKDNVMLSNDKYLIFRRLEEKRNSYFFEFPGLFIKSQLFKDCHETACSNFSHQQIEMGLTLAYFHKGFDSQYYKSSIAKNNIYEIIDNSPNDFISKCRLLTNLDPTQGNATLSGNNFY